MSNLTNVYAFLRNKYPEVNMMLSKPVSYIKTLTGIKNEKIVLIFKEDRSRLSSNYRSPLNSDGSKSDECNLNTTGSPLKDDNSINDIINTTISTKIFLSNPWNEIEEIYVPINIDLARDILTDAVNNKFPKDSHGWIFVICNNELLPAKDTTVLLSAYINEKNHTRGIMRYHGIIKNEEKSIKGLLGKHQSMNSRAKTDIHIESFFEITENVSLKFVNTLPEEKCSLSHINDQSQVFLYQKIEIGKSHMLCEQLWYQIHLLHLIKNDIITAKNNSCDGTLMEPNYSYGKLSYETLQETINRILSEVVVIKEKVEELGDTSLEAVLKRVYDRPLIDITDQIWELIKYASTYNDLRKILTFVFQISSRSSIVNVPMNNNRLAELIRELSQERLAIPHLSSTEPLELLLEIGLEKTMKDYEFIFNESKICKLSEMKMEEGTNSAKTDNRMSIRKSLSAAIHSNQPIARKTLLHGTNSNESNDDLDGFRNSRFNERETEMKLSKLAQMHLVVEHILMIQNNLNLDNDYTTIAKRILEQSLVPFESLLDQKYDKLNLPITDKKVIQLVDNLIPNSQKITMKSENKFKSVENVSYFNIEQIIPFLIDKECENEIADKKGRDFHFISYSKITNKF